MPDIAGNSSTTTSITVGGTVNSSLEVLGDHDWIRITLTAGQSITVLVDGLTLEDSYVYIRNAAGQLLFENDDIVSGVNRDSRVSFTAPATGTYYIDVGAYNEGYTGTYQVSVTTYTPPPLATYDQIADQLVNGYWGGDDHHFAVSEGDSITVNITGLTAAGQALAVAALQTWTDIIGVTFTQVAVGGQIVFDDSQQGAFTDANWSGGIISSAHINISTDWLADYGTGLNSYSFQSYVHEIGHALGLGHAGNYNGSANYPYDASFQNDAWATSIMSYFSQTENTYFAGQGFTENFIGTPMISDIIAMSTLYGLSTTTRTGDTTYGQGSDAGGVYNATTYPDAAYTIFDSGGIDTLNFSNTAFSQQINLNSESFSNVLGFVGTVSIARGTVIENALSGSGNDTLTGNAAANYLSGGAGNDTLIGNDGDDMLLGQAGNDTLDGGAGSDTANYWDVNGAVIVNLSLSGAQNTGGAGTDTLVSIENLIGSTLNDTLTGDANANIIEGSLGNDVLNGGGGVDTLSYANSGAGVTVSLALAGSQNTGGAGADTISNFENIQGSAFNDTLTGNSSANILIGGGGVDTIVGGSGDDIFQDTKAGLNGDTITDLQLGDKIVFTDAVLAGFTFNLTGNTLTYSGGSLTLQAVTGQLLASAAAGGGVQLTLSPTPVATEGDDTLTGTEAADAINAKGGNDTVSGLGGDDVLEGGAGNDTIDGGNGFDTASYASAGSAVTVSLAVAGSQATGGAGSDTLSNIENLLGSAFNDALTGNAGANVLEGAAGNDTLDGGLGSDTASYASVGSGVTVSLAVAGAQNTVGAGNDTLVNMENLTGSAFNDTLTGDSGNNVLSGLAGNDSLVGGAGADTMIGGLGDDKFYVTDAGDVVVEANGEGDDTVFVLGTYTIDQGVSVETLVALNQASTDPLVLTGNEYGQSLYGNLGDNYLNGGQGNDFLVGLAGNDNLLGGTGADNMQGGTGNDVYYVDQAGDQIFENVGEGSDIAVATASWTLNDGAEVETMSADPTAGNINLTGNEFGQSMYGNAGNNILTGMGGADYMVGGAGNDVYYVDPSDFIGEDVGGGDDTIVVATSYTLREGNEIEALIALNQSSTSPVDFTGNEFGQSLYGSDGVNHLDGGAGNDFLVGLGGNDFLVGGLGNDNMQGGTGNDIYYIDSAGDQIFENALEGDDLAVCFASFTLGAGQSVETLSAISGTAAINLTGNALAQSLYGNDGANVLTGGGGADYLAGGAGNDVFVLSAGSVATIADYAALEVVDLSQILVVANGTDVVTGGYVKVTAGGQLQVDLNGGGDSYVTLANVSGSSPVTIRYLSGGNATDITVARSATQEADAKSSQSAQTTTMAMAVAAAGLIAEPLAAKDAPSDSQAGLASPIEASVPHHGAPIPAMADNGAHDQSLAQPAEASIADEPAHASAKPTHAVETELDVSHAAALASPPASEAQAADGAAAPATPAIAAQGIMLPAAELMATMAEASGANGEGQHGHLIGKVLAEALHDGNPLDTLLASLLGHEGNPPLAQIAQLGAADFAAGHDVLAATGFGGHDVLMSHLALHALATHPDAPAAA